MHMRELGRGQRPAGPCLLFVNADWCPHCRTMKPEMAKVAQNLGSALVVLSVDGDAHAPLTSAWGVQGYPTLLFMDARGRVTVYAGPRTARAVTDWACQQSGRCGLNAR